MWRARCPTLRPGPAGWRRGGQPDDRRPASSSQAHHHRQGSSTVSTSARCCETSSAEITRPRPPCWSSAARPESERPRSAALSKLAEGLPHRPGGQRRVRVELPFTHLHALSPCSKTVSSALPISARRAGPHRLTAPPPGPLPRGFAVPRPVGRRRRAAARVRRRRRRWLEQDLRAALPLSGAQAVGGAVRSIHQSRVQRPARAQGAAQELMIEGLAEQPAAARRRHPAARQR